jgi:hypothetical protein
MAPGQTGERPRVFYLCQQTCLNDTGPRIAAQAG